MIRQGGNSLMVKVVMVARNPELEDTTRKKGEAFDFSHGHDFPFHPVFTMWRLSRCLFASLWKPVAKWLSLVTGDCLCKSAKHLCLHLAASSWQHRSRLKDWLLLPSPCAPSPWHQSWRTWVRGHRGPRTKFGETGGKICVKFFFIIIIIMKGKSVFHCFIDGLTISLQNDGQ